MEIKTFVVSQRLTKEMAIKAAIQHCPNGWIPFDIWNGKKEHVDMAHKLLEGYPENSHCFYFIPKHQK